MTSVLGAESEMKAAFDAFDTDGSGALSVDELKAVMTISGGDDPLSEEEINSLIAAFDDNGDGELQYEEFAVLWARKHDDIAPSASPPSVAQQTSSRSAGGADKVKWSGLSSSFKKGKQIGGSFRKAKFSFKKKRPEEPEREMTRQEMRSASELVDLAEAERQNAKEAIEDMEPGKNALSTISSKFEGRLAEALSGNDLAHQARRGSRSAINELLREWDKNGDGEISNIEFRQAVRLHLKVRGSDAEINELFNEFDADKGGKLTLDELKPCLTALERAHRTTGQVSAGLEEQRNRKVAAHRQYAEKLQQASAAMRKVELAEAHINTYHCKLPFEARMGLALISTNKSLDAIVKAWPGQEVGYAALPSFKAGVETLKVPGGYHEAELVAWYTAAFQKGLGEARCRVGGGIQIKHDLKGLMKHGRAAVKEQTKLEVAAEELISAARSLQVACVAAERDRCRMVADVNVEIRKEQEAAAEAAIFKPKGTAAPSAAKSGADPPSARTTSKRAAKKAKPPSLKGDGAVGGAGSRGTPRKAGGGSTGGAGGAPPSSRVQGTGTPPSSRRATLTSKGSSHPHTKSPRRV